MRNMPVRLTNDKSPEIQRIMKDNKEFIRCRTPENLRHYLSGSGLERLYFSAHPIAGNPENFHYDQNEGIVTRAGDGHTFELDEFLCYAFQCDAEGYSHTEYVDIVPGRQERSL